MRRALVLVALSAAAGAATAGPPARRVVTIPHAAAEDADSSGPRYAAVTIEFFCDLSEAGSARIYDLLGELADRHPQRLRIVYRIVGRRGQSDPLAETALEARAQGRLLAFLAAAYAHRRAPMRSEVDDLTAAAGLDRDLVARALASGEHGPELAGVQAYRQRRRVGRIPLLFNGRPMARLARSVDDLEEMYDEAHGRAQGLLAQGVPPARLYERLLSDIDSESVGMPIGIGGIDGPPGAEAPPAGALPVTVAPLLAGRPLARGPDDARVVIFFLCSFQSPNCARMAEQLEAVRRAYPTEVRVVFKHLFDESSPLQRSARLAHEAAACAAAQGRFWDYYDVAFGQQFRIDFEADGMTDRARASGIDADELAACVSERRERAAVDADLKAAAEAGISRTPAIVIGGRLYLGTKSFQELRSLVDAELVPGRLERWLPR